MNIPNVSKKIRYFMLFWLWAALTVSLHSQEPVIDLSPTAGSYSKTTYVEIQNKADTQILYRFAESSDDTWIEYRHPLRLSALPGEERVFTLQIKLRTDDGDSISSYSYTIDRRPPQAPEIQLKSENGSKFFSFSTQEENSDLRINYWLSTFENTDFKTWNGEPQPIETDSTVKAYSQDTAGNISEVVTLKSGTDQPCGRRPRELEVLSPVRGSFANAQWLVIPNAHCYEWVRYSVEDEDPLTNGTAYDGPVLIQSSGRVTLRIRAKLTESSDIHTKTLSYSVEQPEEQFFQAFSPVEYGGPVEEIEYFPRPVAAEGIQLYYSLNDTEVSIHHPQLTSPIEAHAAEGMRNFIPYRIGVYDAAEERMHQYRFFFVVDRRVPANPYITIKDDVPFRKTIRLEMQSSAGADIFYTTDGSTPDRFSRRYTGPITIEAEESSKIGVIPVQAVARYDNGNSSEVVRSLLPFDREVPQAPSYQILKQDSNGADIKIDHPDADSEIVYAIGYGETPLLQINSDSPTVPRLLRVDFPSGFEGGAFLRFAARDQARNLSSSTATVKIDVDSVPPAPPTLKRDESTISFEGEGTIFYRIDPLHSTPRQYNQPINLQVEEGRKKEYTVVYYSQDENENRSRQKTEQIVIDNRIPPPPDFIPDSATNITNDPLSVQCIPPFPDAVIYYQLYRFTEDGSISEDSDTQASAQGRAPGFDDTQYSQPIQLVGSDNREIRYLLKARSYVPASDSWSDTVTTEFTIDRRPPQLPDLQNIVGTGLYSKPVTLSADEAAENQNSWIYVEEATESEEIDLDKIISEGAPLRKGVTISGAPGEERNYLVTIASIDSAGNSAIGETTEIIIDRQRPDPPALQGIPATPDTGGPVEITAPSDYRHKIVYELSTDGSTPPKPDRDSDVLESEPLVLASPNTESETNIYRLAYCGIDQAGNMSAVKTTHMRVSRKVPDPPEIHIEQLGAQLFLLKIETDNDNQAYLKLNEGEFQAFDREVMFYQSRKGTALEVSAYTENSYGIRSETATRRISYAAFTRSLVEGVEKGGLYNEDVIIRPTATDTDIRYELFTQNAETNVLGADSPSLSDSLSIQVARGQTEHFVFKAGVYDAETNTVLAKQTYSFTIDKAAPLPPDIVGIQSDYHYTEDQTVRILPRDDATIYFRTREASGPETAYRQYVQPEKVRVRPGTRKDIIVEAWSEDQAGNQSRVVRQEFVIDKASIYVAPDGKDAFSGGKENPFRSIDRALYEARTTNRNTIYLASGDYKISNPVTVRNQLNIVGGLNKNTWKTDSSGQTFLSIGSDFAASKPLFSILQGSLKLENLTLSNIDLENALCVQEGQYSNLIIRNSTVLHANGNAPTIIWSKSGNFVFNNSLIDVGPVHNGSVLRIEDASAVLRSSVISSDSASGTLTLLDLNGADIEIIESELAAGNSEYIRVIDAADSEIEISNSAIDYGAAEVRSTGIRHIRGKLVMHNATVGNGSRPAHIASAIEIENINAELSGLDMEGSAAVGLVQFRSKDSSLNIVNSRMHNKRTREFSYLLRTYGGSCSVKDSDLTADSSYDVYGIELHNDSVAMLQNSSLELMRGENNTIGIAAEGPVVCTVQESRLLARRSSGAASTGAADTVAVTQDTASADIKLVNNLFSGWDLLLKTPNRSARTTEELQAEVPPFDKKTPHRGNRVE